MLLFQVAFGIFRGSKGGPSACRTNGTFCGDHYSMTRWRRRFEFSHKFVGYLTLATAAGTVLVGLWDVNAPRGIWLLLTLWWFILIILSIALQKRSFALDTYQAIWGPDPIHPGNQLPPPGWGMHRRCQKAENKR